MEMPTVYDDDVFDVEHGVDPEGNPRRVVVYSMVFPPVGFFPFAGTGNGDYHGFYWPIGRELDAPIVAYSSHDAYGLIPEHGDLPSLGRCQIARSGKHSLNYELTQVFATAQEPVPTVDIDREIAVDDHRQLLELDPHSAFRNCAVADLDIADGNFAAAEEHYRAAIRQVPEYGAAHFGLAYLLRRLRRPEDASIHLRQCLICPLVFWGGCFWADHILPGSFRNDWARKALMWLQKTPIPHETLRDDPFVQIANDLNMQTGTAWSHDLELLNSLVDTYAQRGSYLDAVYIWTTIGDRAAMETTSFRERYKLTPRTFATRLSKLLRCAENMRRASLVDNMLSAMNKPDGLYL